MRISDWSSDVCSSDLSGADGRRDRLRQVDVARGDARLPQPEFARPYRHDRRPDRIRASAPGLHGDAARGRHRHVLVGQRAEEHLAPGPRSEEHTSELQSLMRISYAVFCLKKKNIENIHKTNTRQNTRHICTKHMTHTDVRNKQKE